MRRIFTAFIFSSLVWVPRAALACATCYGAADSAQTHSLNMAIFTLLGVVATVIGLFVVLFVFFMIRAKTLATKGNAAVQIDPVEMGHLVEVNVHE